MQRQRHDFIVNRLPLGREGQPRDTAIGFIAFALHAARIHQ